MDHFVQRNPVEIRGAYLQVSADVHQLTDPLSVVHPDRLVQQHQAVRDPNVGWAVVFQKHREGFGSPQPGGKVRAIWHWAPSLLVRW